MCQTYILLQRSSFIILADFFRKTMHNKADVNSEVSEMKVEGYNGIF